jgi:hypothetical protein
VRLTGSEARLFLRVSRRFRPSNAGCHVASSSSPHRGSSLKASAQEAFSSLSVGATRSSTSSDEDEDEPSMVTGVSSSTRVRSNFTTRGALCFFGFFFVID